MINENEGGAEHALALVWFKLRREMQTRLLPQLSGWANFIV
ncbi:MAG: hypothetical protein RMJ86_03955 [Anaerolineae bacterium]|nr:hypothetical protein [Thermoflexales bacterium]MDW8053685.1 hypothetical protein [Anaerolineae bacterium]MDW8293414.1 hypothetical protein [Anaerolineae bacterium]